MKTGSIKVAGCDVGKDSLHVCIMHEPPANLKNFARSYKPIIVKADAEGIETLLALDADIYVLEPTGHYAYIWLQVLTKAKRNFRLVSSRRVRHFCEYRGLVNKGDRPDAAAIACYTLENMHDEQAFLKIERLKIRELYLQISSTTRSKNPIQNRLGQRLSFEFPEILPQYEGSARRWMDEKPPATYRFLAGETVDDWYKSRREGKYANSIGSGLTPHTRSLAKQLCEFEKMEYELEAALEQELANEEFEKYRRVFERFAVPNRIQAALLSRIYPFEDFLRNGKPLKEYVRGTDSRRKSGMTKRDRSEGEFKLSLGMGKTLFQSGNQTSWKASGAKYARTALWQYVKVVVVIRRSGKGCNFSTVVGELEKKHRQNGVDPWLNRELIESLAAVTSCTPEVTALRLHYEFQADKKGDRRVAATAGRFCRMLYKALVDEFRLKS